MKINGISGLRPLLALLFAAPLAACGSDPTPPPVAPVSAATAATNAQPAAAAPAKKADTASPTAGSVHIEDKILKACGDLPTAHFAFDSASVDPEAGRALDALARCFATGPLKGKGMRLVGHADPRGETEYNLALGQRRAGSVADYLTGKGVAKANVKALSKGEFEAVGTDEAGWARDRKVEVFLAE